MNKQHTNCRVCNSNKLISYLNLGEMPLANNNTATKELSLESPKHSLELMFCDECALSQLSLVVDPFEMFSNYDYRSAVNKGYVAHCLNMATSLQSKYKLIGDELHIDIAGNDGTLLKEFKKVMGENYKVYNVDPAENLCAIAEMEGIQSICDFWGTDLFDDGILTDADLITATNVFAHVDDVNGFIKAAQLRLAPHGILILEFPYLVDFIEKLEFDTIYHEHLSYFSICPLMRLCGKHGMKLIDVEKLEIHGGSVRVHITHDENPIPISSNVNRFINNEISQGYTNIGKYLDWAEKVNAVVENFCQSLIHLARPYSSGDTCINPKIAAFAASAKGNTLLNYSKINHNDIEYIIDETPEKIGKYYSGTGIQIVNKSNLVTNSPDYLLILSWNFKDDIIAKCKQLGYKGKFIIPSPTFQIID